MSTSFHYFDQFTPVTFNLNKYLDNVKEISGIDYTFTNIQPINATLANLFEKVELIVDYKKSVLDFTPYVINDNERIENVAYTMYGDIDYWWLIALFNNIKNMFIDWPMNQEQLSLLSEELFIKEAKYSKSVYYDLLFERNETKRNILIPKYTSIENIVSKFRTAFEEKQFNT